MALFADGGNGEWDAMVPDGALGKGGPVGGVEWQSRKEIRTTVPCLCRHQMIVMPLWLADRSIDDIRPLAAHRMGLPSLPAAAPRCARGDAMSRGRFFEDFQAGETLVHAVPRTLTEGDQATYIALTGDRYPLHCAASYAQSLGLRRESINDLLVFHTVFGKSVTDISLNAVANLGYANVRFLAPVYPGDTLRSESKVIGTRENSSGKTGIVWVETEGRNQDDVPVLRFNRWVMVHKRNPETPTGAKDRPEMAPEIDPSNLVIPSLDLSANTVWVSGATRFYEDYEVGERVLHPGGMTLEEADHMMATRLYQNTAKVHFDGHGMQDTRFGRRLIYGGHIISVCRALSFSGLEAGLAVLGFNGGTHAAPTFAGDTLYAYTEILDRQPAPNTEGAGLLRLRLVGTKNLDPTKEAITTMVEKDGKQVRHPAVVLDLDYWLLMPHRPA